MLKLIHELLGTVAQYALYTSVTAAVLVFKYRYVREYWGRLLPERYKPSRKLLLNVHRGGALLFIIAMFFHFWLANPDDRNVLLISIPFFAGILLLWGFAFRFKKHFASRYQSAVYAKAIVMAVLACVIWIGHGIAEKRIEEREGTRISETAD
ncbi:hypothetical protein [Limisalsivibrio acetivorans]|uniref:hypothetical protein n=1 Tax=Limisalsivibrio acetivorans TaxID=1304888 RepID=UPI0003B39B6F|nr:hypothetical protein [Limisalsivibrio acetivorans]